ncbi:TetR/AcrR family transcriptional regulator [Frankia sp. R82]|uniref:TetR/AcrR family transcriptional regulator n=1 Tax=Frankia sp. R82 TaxID=2950553 RepID=UPI0020433566|nr:TetR/AcrR family transcriptional regulator [Frankia sp. R82]MCM3883872.1 TetR/AcrR family transcriptional regulator [Frankia sp. R82]
MSQPDSDVALPDDVRLPRDASTRARSGRRQQGWWGSESALLDDAEARRRLIAAAGRCVVRRGSSRIRIEEVAVEAGVSRSTVYRYFHTRDDLILAVLLDRVDTGMDAGLDSQPDPDDARITLVEMLVRGASLIDSDALTEALFAAGGRASVDSLPLAAEPIVEAVYRRMQPLLQRWQSSGQLHADLDLWEAVRWLISAGGAMMTPPWSARSLSDKRLFAERYLIRALVQTPASCPPTSAPEPRPGPASSAVPDS